MGLNSRQRKDFEELGRLLRSGGVKGSYESADKTWKKRNKPVPKYKLWQLVFYSFSIAIFSLIAGGITNNIYFVGITFFSVFFVSLFLILRWHNFARGIANKIAIVGVVEEVQHKRDEREVGREIVRIATYPRIVDFQGYLMEKGHNQNIAIIGMAGSGKTEITYFIINQIKYHKIIFQYKNSDRYRELGYPVLFLKNYSPDVFRDREAFTQAWITAFAVENRGITASQIIPLIRNAVDKCSNWQEFKAEIEKELKENEGTITGNALSDIRLKLDSVYSDKQYEIEIPQDIVIDFENLNKDAFVFYAEYLLRELYGEIKAGSRVGTMIFVDEAHAFTKTGNTIIPDLSAIIRSRGAFLFATQRASTIAGDIKGNAGTQFCFRQTEREDLNEISALSEPYHWIAQRLKPYEFVDLAQQDSHEGIYVYRLINPKPDFKPVVEWKPQTAKKENSERQGGKEIDIPSEIIRLLVQAGNIQDLGKRFAKEFGGDPDNWRGRIYKTVDKMFLTEEIGGIKTDFVRFTKKAMDVKGSIIYHRKGDYSYHDWLVGITADILYHKGLIPHIQAHGLPLADILVESPKKLAFEIEAGTKNGSKIEETKQRIADFEKQGYKVYVIVPNSNVKQKYKEFENVYTALELWRGNYL